MMQATPGDKVNPRRDAGRDTGGQQQAHPLPMPYPSGRAINDGPAPPPQPWQPAPGVGR